MIITVPTYKQKFNKNKYIKLNESLFDDDIFGEDNDESSNDTLLNTIGKEYELNTLKPRVERVLKQLSVENYEIICTGQGINVDVHDHLFLPNKKLNKLGISSLFKFNTVDGDCVFTGNNLEDWSLFPRVIYGDCYANFNNIKTFDGAPYIYGDIIANKQNKKSTYPLTKETYDAIVNKSSITENTVYVIPANKKGELCSISERTNTCIVKFDDNTKQKVKLNEVEYIGDILNLII